MQRFSVPHLRPLPLWQTLYFGAARALLATAGAAQAQTPATFAAAAAYSAGPNSYPVNVAVADVNGDGRPDIVTANEGTSTAGVLLNTTTTISATPILTSLSPASGLVGTSATITGTNYWGLWACRLTARRLPPLPW